MFWVFFKTFIPSQNDNWSFTLRRAHSFLCKVRQTFFRLLIMTWEANVKIVCMSYKLGLIHKGNTLLPMKEILPIGINPFNEMT